MDGAMTDADPLVVVAVDETTNAKTGIVTRSPIYSRLSEVKAARTADLQQQIRDHVETHMPTSEREALAALMQKTTLMRMVGAPVDEGASLALVMSLGWAEQAMIMGDDAAQACARADTIEALQAITVDLDKLGAPPKITAGEIAKALRSNP
jgi:hypothetical protein